LVSLELCQVVESPLWILWLQDSSFICKRIIHSLLLKMHGVYYQIHTWSAFVKWKLVDWGRVHLQFMIYSLFAGQEFRLIECILSHTL
jgi:hypothetical protein